MTITKVISILTLASLLTMALTIYLRIPYIFLLINFVTNIAYIIIQSLEKKEQQKLSSLILHGEVLINALFTIWLFFLQSPQYIFYLPLCLSISAKLYQIIAQKQTKNQTITENYILLQGKLQFLMLVYLNFLLFINILAMNFKLQAIFMYILVILLFRIKYQVNFAFQRSINQIHLFFDKLCKKMGFRRIYQKFYKFLVKIFFINDYNTGKRVVRY